MKRRGCPELQPSRWRRAGLPHGRGRFLLRCVGGIFHRRRRITLRRHGDFWLGGVTAQFHTSLDASREVQVSDLHPHDLPKPRQFLQAMPVL